MKREALLGVPDAKATARLYKEKFPWADEAALAVSLGLLSAQTAQLATMNRLSAMNRFSGPQVPGLTAARFSLVRVLYFAPDHRQTQHEIASKLRVTSGNVTYLVDGLEKDGIVVRTDHPTDRRTTLVQLTPKGLEICDSQVPGAARIVAELLQGFSEQEKQLFSQFLDRFEQNARACLNEM
jgi:MarR family 2-MHQ and catechol resistance regulon transcriptional repressor